MKRTGLMAVLAVAAALAHGAELNGIYTDEKTINQVLQSIPMIDKSMSYQTLADRLPNLRLKVISIDVGPYTAEEAKIDPEHIKRGDIDYQFTITEPNEVVRSICPLNTRFSLTKRGSKWLPQDRTSNFLLNGYNTCRPPR